MKLCECGCGKPAPIAKKTRTYRNQVAGQIMRFISGHNVRTLTSEEQSRRGQHNTGEKLRGTGTAKHYPKLHQQHAHRVIAVQLLGRELLPDEVVHHEDNDRTNFAPDNIKVFPNQSEHARYHMLQQWSDTGIRRAKV